MVYPSKSGLDSWEKLGNPGWNAEIMAPYYRKFHTLNKPSNETHQTLGLDFVDEKVQGTLGPIQASFDAGASPLDQAWPKTFTNLNYKITGDPISGQAIGGFTNPSTIHPRTKARSYVGNTYYNSETSQRPNWHVLTGVLAERIIFGKSKEDLVSATGVQYTTKAGERRIVHANDQVILAAGTFQSPQLLELSGIGAADHLKTLNIETIVDNPHVGENLQDHGIVCASFEVADGVPSGDMMRDPQVFQAMMKAYETARAGPMCSAPMSSAFMPVVDFLHGNGRNQLVKLLDEYLASTKSESFPSQNLQYELLRRMLQDPDDASIHYSMGPFQVNAERGPALRDILSPSSEGNYMTIVSALCHPFSRGSVHISSADPRQPPSIDPNYLSHPLDIEIHARHLQYLETLTKTEPLASLLKKDGRRIPHSLDLRELKSAKELCVNTLSSNYHPTGTCAMMSKELGGVVNERLIVHGTRNLRVVDASIIPMEPRGNIQSSVYAIAERAADMIKADTRSDAHM